MKYMHFLWYVHNGNPNHDYTTSFTTDDKELCAEEVIAVIKQELGTAVVNKSGWIFGIKNLTTLPVKTEV